MLGLPPQQAPRSNRVSGYGCLYFRETDKGAGNNRRITAGKNQTAGRKLARSGVFGKKVGKSPFGYDCVVADAVHIEPVSATKFPVNREINREYREIEARRSNCAVTLDSNHGAFWRNSL
ncbi:MAG: hypothetical protein WBF03_02145 [Xanthobacteraceae bacterium]